MKRLNLIALSLMVTATSAIAGGLVTNTNQSAAWARTLTREASLGVDAVYYNPAGLAQLNNGLHLSISNQTIFQTRTITSNYAFLNPTPKTYEAELLAPIFPSIYAAYKLDKWAFSAGFNVIGGGGTADFQQGLPSFEIPVSGLVPYMQQTLMPLDALFEGATGVNPGFANITGYNMDASFTGSSTYYGIQVGATYAITEMISVAIGGRYVMANNSYEGSLTNITIDAPAAYGGTMAAGDYGRVLSGIVTPFNPDAGAQLAAAAAQLDAQTADKYLNATQSGSGFTPIIGLNVHLSDMVNIAARYEHHTKIELTNETEVDDVGMFPDGEKTRGDLPGMFSVGAQVKPLQKLSLNASFNYFLDKGAFYGNTDADGEQINNETTIDENAYSISFSAEYKILGILGVSAGYNFGNLGVNDNYQSDRRYANKSSSIAGGVFVEVGKMVTINAGYVYVMYDDYSEELAGPPAWTDTYGKKTDIVAIGVDFSF
ncbi:MAG: outer membrane beta-barrel protein [Bacteroidales bacterium]